MTAAAQEGCIVMSHTVWFIMSRGEVSFLNTWSVFSVGPKIIALISDHVALFGYEDALMPTVTHLWNYWVIWSLYILHSVWSRGSLRESLALVIASLLPQRAASTLFVHITYFWKQLQTLCRKRSKWLNKKITWHIYIQWQLSSKYNRGL